MEIAQLKHSRGSSNKIDAREGAKYALEYFNRLFPNSKISNVALEEVDFVEDENCWLITLGFDDFATSTKTAQGLSLQDMIRPQTRKYKVFKVNARTGRVLSMKIRKLE